MRLYPHRVSAGRTLIQADHGNTPFEFVGLAFDGETQQLASTPTFNQIGQFFTAEQAGINILQRDGIVSKGQASKLQNFFQRELQVLGSQGLSGDLPSARCLRLSPSVAQTAGAEGAAQPRHPLAERNDK
jgi:hypothetical protein